MIRRTLLAQALFPCLFLSGCGGEPQSTPEKGPDFSGVELRISVAKGAPFLDALRARVQEFESLTQAKVAIEEVAVVDPNATLMITTGVNVPSEATPFPTSILSTSRLSAEDFGPMYRNNFLLRNDRIIASALTADHLTLWYRKDLYEDPALKDAYKAATNFELAPPLGWQEFSVQARFFQENGKAKFGCAEAMDESPAAMRNYIARAASYGKSVNWYSSVISVDNGEPRLATPAFQQALKNWIECRASSPAAQGEPIDDAAARRRFQAGEAALLVSTTAPTVGLDAKDAAAFAAKVGVALLPGGEALPDVEGGTLRPRPTINRCAHFATRGWFVALGKAERLDAAGQLLLFIVDSRAASFITATTRLGLPIARWSQLDDPDAYPGYGLTQETTRQYFEFLRQAISNDNWISDFPPSLAQPLQAALIPALASAMSGKVEPVAALQTANEELAKAIAPDRQAIVRSFRQSLSLPERTAR